ncbi:MAG: sigma-70 family RNA polymerase sigma factor [Chloroflexi bacterium]|nr:sigma-70 family RNA polymerase sigma factor [Chloroflexota bacterium]
MSGPTLMTAQQETELVDQAIAGDRGAFAKLYDAYYDRVYRHVYYRVGRVEDAEDLTQQIFLQAWRGLGRYQQTGSPFHAWLFTIAHNVVVSFYRRAKPASYLEHDLREWRAEGNPEREAEEQWERERVRKAVLRLKPDQQQVITMRFLEHLEHRDIAAALGKSEGNVRVIQHRALQELRRMLEREER